MSSSCSVEGEGLYILFFSQRPTAKPKIHSIFPKLLFEWDRTRNMAYFQRIIAVHLLKLAIFTPCTYTWGALPTLNIKKLAPSR
jgi:hypothetical protein